VAIGNRWGTRHRHHRHRQRPARRTAGGRGLGLKDLIQTDASINRATRAGRVNILGELIGLNTAIRSDAQNIGFAIRWTPCASSCPRFSPENRRRLEVGLGGLARPGLLGGGLRAAEKAGVQVGDEVVRVDNVLVKQDLDYYVHLLNVDPSKGVGWS